MAWSGGAAIYFINKKSRIDSTQLLDLWEQNEITHATLVPSLIRAIAEQEGALKRLKQQGLKAIFSTGEVCTPELVSQLEQADIECWNCYGPTENTLGMSMKKITSDMIKDDIVPIAFPEGDEIKIALLDEKKEEVPVGGKGTLYITSPYLTPGYFNREKENSKKFWMNSTGKRFFALTIFFLKKIIYCFSMVGKMWIQ
ncbi:MAG: AMP-binding protein [Gammaproteobacteria bacterium]